MRWAFGEKGAGGGAQSEMEKHGHKLEDSSRNGTGGHGER